MTAGTVTLADNDSGTALYSLANAKPGDTSGPQCIRVSYTGSLDANVKLYTPSTIGALGPEVNLKIEAGTQASPSFPSCTGFVAAPRSLLDPALRAGRPGRVHVRFHASAGSGENVTVERVLPVTSGTPRLRRSSS